MRIKAKKTLFHLSIYIVTICFICGISQDQSTDYTLESTFYQIYKWGIENLKLKDPEREYDWSLILEDLWSVLRNQTILIEYIEIDPKRVRDNMSFAIRYRFDQLPEKLRFPAIPEKTKLMCTQEHIVQEIGFLHIALYDWDIRFFKDLKGKMPVPKKIIGKIYAANILPGEINLKIEILSWSKINKE